MNVALLLGRVRPLLEPQLAVGHHLLELGDGVGADVLESVLDAAVEVGQELKDGAFVGDRAADTLGYLELVGLVVEVPVHGRALGVLAVHRLDGAHAAVLLQPDAVVEEVLAGRLGGAGQQRAHHDRARADAEGLDDVADGLDAAVGDDGHAVARRVLGDLVDGRRLGAAHRHHLLRDADGPGAHAHAQPVGAGLDEVARLRHADHVAGHHLELRVRRLYVLDHLDLVDRVALRGVQDDDVDPGLDQLPQPQLVGLARPHGGPDEQLLVPVLGGVGVAAVLLQVGPRHQRDELALVVDDGQLALLRLLEDGVGLPEGDAGLRGDQLIQPRHDRLELDALLAGRVVEEVDVARRHDAEQLAAELAVLGDGHAGEAALGLHLHHVVHAVARREHERVADEPVLVLLHLEQTRASQYSRCPLCKWRRRVVMMERPCELPPPGARPSSCGG